MTYGIFSDEGCIEDGFADFSEAESRRIRCYLDDDCHVGEVCPDHPEHERHTCEACNEC